MIKNDVAKLIFEHVSEEFYKNMDELSVDSLRWVHHIKNSSFNNLPDDIKSKFVEMSANLLESVCDAIILDIKNGKTYIAIKNIIVDNIKSICCGENNGS